MTDRGGERTKGDPDLFWHDQDLIHELRTTEVYADGSNSSDIWVLMGRAADTIARMHDEMISPGEYMRVSNERGRLFSMLDAALMKEKESANV